MTTHAGADLHVFESENVQRLAGNLLDTLSIALLINRFH